MEKGGVIHIACKTTRNIEGTFIYRKGYAFDSSFATEFNCSEKTIRNDLQEIENDLKNFKSANLIRKPGVGISLQISKEDKKRLIALLYSNQSNYLEKLELTGAEIQEVTYRLLMERNLTVRSLSQHYFVSTPNMRRELEKIRNWLTTKNIKLKTKQRVGLMIEGMEQDIRMALISWMKYFLRVIGNHSYFRQCIHMKYRGLNPVFINC